MIVSFFLFVILFHPPRTPKPPTRLLGNKFALSNIWRADLPMITSRVGELILRRTCSLAVDLLIHSLPRSLIMLWARIFRGSDWTINWFSFQLACSCCRSNENSIAMIHGHWCVGRREKRRLKKTREKDEAIAMQMPSGNFLLAVLIINSFLWCANLWVLFGFYWFFIMAIN